VDYIPGSGASETRRLAFQHRVWAAQATEAWEAAGFKPGDRLADLGCGPGFGTFDLAEWVGPAGHVLGVDGSQAFVRQLEAGARGRGLRQIEGLVGDVQRLDLPEASLDGVYMRWVLCFVERPQAVVDAAARALKPGGTLLVQDYFNLRSETVSPAHPAIDRVFAGIDSSWRHRGGNPDVAGELPRRFREAGLAVRTVRPRIRVGSPGSPLWRWIEDVIELSVPLLRDGGVLSAGDVADFDRAWDRVARDPDALFCSPPLFDVIGVKEGRRS
jgi:SAM-dependent methyltransferase